MQPPAFDDLHFFFFGHGKAALTVCASSSSALALNWASHGSAEEAVA